MAVARARSDRRSSDERQKLYQQTPDRVNCSKLNFRIDRDSSIAF
ncbi:MAG: hypothetical protein WBA77_10385 [Microcoleaceae cyanobacterium]